MMVLFVALLAATPVKITTASGGGASAHYTDGGESAGVLFFTMCRDDAAEGWSPVVERLQAAGISSLVITSPSVSDRQATADAALAYLRSRVGKSAPVAVAGSSCGVAFSLMAASGNPTGVRAVVAFSGPHASYIDFVRKTPAVAVFSGASESETPAIEWARELRAASSVETSRMKIVEGHAHGTDIFREKPEVAVEIADWLAAQLKRRK